MDDQEFIANSDYVLLCFFVKSKLIIFELFYHFCHIHYMKSAQIQSYFWSAFLGIQTEYRDLFRKSPYSVRVPQNTDQK